MGPEDPEMEPTVAAVTSRASSATHTLVFAWLPKPCSNLDNT